MKVKLLASAAAVTIAAIAPAMAQEAASTDAPAQKVEEIDPAAQAGELIVTATRRAERIQDVPISVSAFQQEELTEKGIVEIGRAHV